MIHGGELQETMDNALQKLGIWESTSAPSSSRFRIVPLSSTSLQKKNTEISTLTELDIINATQQPPSYMIADYVYLLTYADGTIGTLDSTARLPPVFGRHLKQGIPCPVTCDLLRLRDPRLLDSNNAISFPWLRQYSLQLAAKFYRGVSPDVLQFVAEDRIAEFLSIVEQQQQQSLQVDEDSDGERRQPVVASKRKRKGNTSRKKRYGIESDGDDRDEKRHSNHRNKKDHVITPSNDDDDSQVKNAIGQIWVPVYKIVDGVDAAFWRDMGLGLGLSEGPVADLLSADIAEVDLIPPLAQSSTVARNARLAMRRLCRGRLSEDDATALGIDPAIAVYAAARAGNDSHTDGGTSAASSSTRRQQHRHARGKNAQRSNAKALRGSLTDSDSESDISPCDTSDSEEDAVSAAYRGMRSTDYENAGSSLSRGRGSDAHSGATDNDSARLEYELAAAKQLLREKSRGDLKDFVPFLPLVEGVGSTGEDLLCKRSLQRCK